MVGRSFVQFGWTKHTKLDNTLDCSKPGRQRDKAELQQLLTASGRYPHPDIVKPGGLIERMTSHLNGKAGFYVIRHIEALADMNDVDSHERLTKHLARALYRYEKGTWPVEGNYSTFENADRYSKQDRQMPFSNMTASRFEGPSTGFAPHYDFLPDHKKNGIQDYLIGLYNASQMTNVKRGSGQFQVIDLSQKYRDQRKQGWRGSFHTLIQQANQGNMTPLERYTKTIPYDAENEVMIAIVNNRGGRVQYHNEPVDTVTPQTVGIAHTATYPQPKDPDQPMHRTLYHATVRLNPRQPQKS